MVLAERFRDAVFQPLADGVAATTGLNCFTAARLLMRAAAVVAAVRTIQVYADPRGLSWFSACACGYATARGVLQLRDIDRGLRGVEAGIARNDGSARVVWPRFRDRTWRCVVFTAFTWGMLALIMSSPSRFGVPWVAAVSRALDVVLFGGAGIVAMFLTCEARRPPPRTAARGLVPEAG